MRDNAALGAAQLWWRQCEVILALWGSELASSADRLLTDVKERDQKITSRFLARDTERRDLLFTEKGEMMGEDSKGRVRSLGLERDKCEMHITL